MPIGTVGIVDSSVWNLPASTLPNGYRRDQKESETAPPRTWWDGKAERVHWLYSLLGKVYNLALLWWCWSTRWTSAGIPTTNMNIGTCNSRKTCSRRFRPIILIPRKAHWNCSGSKSGARSVSLRYVWANPQNESLSFPLLPVREKIDKEEGVMTRRIGARDKKIKK